MSMCIYSFEYYINETAHPAKLVMEKGIRAMTCVRSSCLKSAASS